MVGVAFTLLAPPKLGWEAAAARRRLLWAVVLFALGVALPAFTVIESKPGFLVAGNLLTAVGLVVYFLAVLDFRRLEA